MRSLWTQVCFPGAPVTAKATSAATWPLAGLGEWRAVALDPKVSFGCACKLRLCCPARTTMGMTRHRPKDHPINSNRALWWQEREVPRGPAQFRKDKHSTL